MSMSTAFHYAKDAARKGVIGIAAAATMFGANITNVAHADTGLTQRECLAVFGVSSEVIGILHPGGKGLLPAFTEDLARFIAPSNPGPVQTILVNGNFNEFSVSKRPEDVALRKAIKPTLECSGRDGTDVLRVDDEAAATLLGIRRELLGADLQVSLEGKLSLVDVNKVAGVKPTPAAYTP